MGHDKSTKKAVIGTVAVDEDSSEVVSAANGSAVRARVIGCFIDCVVESGISGATYRAVAARAGVSIGTVQHYFPEKQSLIEEALLEMHERSRRAAPAPLDGWREVEARLLRGLPLTEERQGLWPFYVEYWAQATRDPAVRDFHLARWERIAAMFLDTLEGNRPSLDDLPVLQAPTRLEDVVDALIALQFGLGVHATIHPERYSPERLRRLLQLTMRSLLVSVHEGAQDVSD